MQLPLPSRSDAIIFLVCVLFAAMFWILNALSQQYSSVAKVGITVEGIPSGQALKAPLPEYLLVTVEGPGWDLMGYRLREKAISLQLDYARIRESELITADNIRGDVNNLFPKSVQVQDIQPDSLITKVTPLESKALLIRPNVSFELAEGYGLSKGIALEPSVIELTAPKGLLDTLAYIPTKRRNYGKLKQSVDAPIALKLPDHPSLSAPFTEVRISIPAERLTEDKVQVPVYPASEVRQGQVSFLPRNVQVTYKVSLSRYNQISADSFRCVADIPPVAHPDSMKGAVLSLPVRLERQPAFIYQPDLRPAYVDYIIETN